MKKMTVVLILISLFMSMWGLTGAMAADASGKQNGAIEIRLKAGSEQVEINGQTLTVEKPFEANGTTLVPLRVITSAFGTKLSWDSKTQTIGLEYAGHSINLKIGSKAATKDTQNVQLNVAPQIKNDTTMVPIRFISENFGAKVGYDSATKEIVITGILQTEQKAVPGNINTDEGKTSIGNSYYNWSMKYPSGLETSYQSFKGDYVEFSDAAGEYSIEISVEPISEENISDSGLLQKASDQSYGGDTVLDSRIVRSGGIRYARIVSKTQQGSYFEDRAYVNSGNIYFLTFRVFKAENYKNTTKYQGYQSLLDSFKTSFDASESTLKDLSSIKNGYLIYNDDDYGLSLEIPAEWTKVGGGHSLKFSSSDDNQMISLSVSSLADGDSLAAWVNREMQRFKDTFVESYRKLGDMKSLTISGSEAKSVEFTFTMGKNWTTDETVYFTKGKYKYSLEFIYPQDSAKQADLQTIIKHVKESVSIDVNKFNPALGIIQDPNDTYDRNKRITVKNSKYHFSLEIPEYWEASGGNDETLMRYSFTGGSLNAYVITDSTMDEFIKRLEDRQALLKSTTSDFKVLENTYVPMFGLMAKKYVTEITNDGVTVTATSYLFSKDNVLYGFDLVIFKAASTPENLKRLNDAMLSFKFLN
ncbi:copper amine oxidase N-terminal domain-containing protein [Ferviditalea candida]|uniref:Copper amine oxidase N-terminal domain-containing protein n=1 Tax=Ferviditalea candida TaxID=3108399 RepID=A0ABU5ZIP4_9BACL|nr:copper amine oxidase N-terminal domain-containing protein [Paenibacillaceae bacterium T2]